jgi:hypothetical protein
LRSDSPYLNKGFGGKRIGADLDAKLVGGKWFVWLISPSRIMIFFINNIGW